MDHSVPIMLIATTDPTSRRNLGEELRRRYGADYEVVVCVDCAHGRTTWLPDTVERDPAGFLCTGASRDVSGAGSVRPDRSPLALETSIPGIFAIGDVRAGSIKRVATAVGDGATVVSMLHTYLAENPVPASSPARSDEAAPEELTDDVLFD